MRTPGFSFRWLYAIAAFSILAGGSHAQADQVSDVKDAGIRIGGALLKGDMQTVKKHTIGNEKTDKFVESMGALSKAKTKLSDAAEAKFGDSGKDIVAGGDRMEWKKQIEGADVQIDGDTATVTPKPRERAGARAQPAGAANASYFKKVGGEWKMDLTRMPGLDAMQSTMAIFPVMAKAMEETAAEIDADKYKSAPEAKKALGMKTAAAIQASLAAKAAEGDKDSKSDK